MAMMQYLLRDVVTLSSGVFAGTSTVHGEIYYLQGRHYDADGNLLPNLRPDLPANDRLKKNFLKAGDVLIVAKGQEHYAVCYDERIAPAVASSIFIVLRISDLQQVLPAYLRWYLNHPETQKSLSAHSKGTSLPSISKADLSTLQIPIPPMEMQLSIVQLHVLWKKEKRLSRQLQLLKEQNLQKQLLQTVQKSA